MNRQEYWNQIEAIAQEVTREAREFDSEISDTLHETIDGHEFVIYYANAHEVMTYTDNREAFADNFGTEGLEGKNYDEIAQVFAYCAMEADVRDHSEFNTDSDDDEN